MADLETGIAIKIYDMFTGPLRRLNESLKDTEQAAARAEKKFRLSADLNQAAEGMNRFASGVLGPLKAAVTEFASFESAMSQVSALSGEMKGGAGFEALKQQALDLGAATAYSAEETANAQAVYAQAGRSADEILKLTPMTLAAAKANGMGLAETASIVGHTMAQLKLPVEQTGHVVDVLTASAAASDMTLGDMGTAMAYVGPVAKQAGMSLETTAAILGKMKDAGLEASSTGVGLRAVLTRLLDPSKEAQGALRKLGLSQKQVAEMQKQVASGKVVDALRAIGTAADKLPNEQRMKLMSQIFGMEAQTAASIAVSASMDVGKGGIEAAAAAFQKADGTAQKLADVMGDNLEGAMERASGAISGLSTKAGELLAPSMHQLADMTELSAGAMQDFIKENPNFSAGLLEGVGTLGLAATALGGMLTATSALTSASAFATAQFAVMRTSLVGQGGLLLAAGMAGWAIGRFISKTFDLENRILKMLGIVDVEKRDKPGLGGPGENQELRGGWVINPKTGEVVKTGTAETAPASVRAAAGAGARTKEEMNAWLAKREKTWTPAGPMAKSFAPVSTKGFESIALPQVDETRTATEAQTAELVKALHQVEEAAKQKANPPQYSSYTTGAPSAPAAPAYRYGTGTVYMGPQ